MHEEGGKQSERSQTLHAAQIQMFLFSIFTSQDIETQPLPVQTAETKKRQLQVTDVRSWHRWSSSS